MRKMYEESLNSYAINNDISNTNFNSNIRRQRGGGKNKKECEGVKLTNICFKPGTRKGYLISNYCS